MSVCKELGTVFVAQLVERLLALPDIANFIYYQFY